MGEPIKAFVELKTFHTLGERRRLITTLYCRFLGFRKRSVGRYRSIDVMKDPDVAVEEKTKKMKAILIVRIMIKANVGSYVGSIDVYSTHQHIYWNHTYLIDFNMF